MSVGTSVRVLAHGLVVGVLLAACTADVAAPSGSVPARPSASESVSHAPSPVASESATMADGEPWIVYQWTAGSADGIFLVRPDGTGNHQLLPELAGSEIHPDWSPDGSRIAFIRITLEDRKELWVVNADGSGEEMLSSCELPCNSVIYPAWAPDGFSIYYTQDANVPAGGGPPTTFMIGKLDLASGEASVVLTREDGMTIDQPRVSPDGTMVVFTRFKDVFDDAAGSAIFVADLEGGAETRLTDWELFGAYPDWTPDGRIVFNSYDLGAFQETTNAANLYIVNADGSGLDFLTHYGEADIRATQPRVAADGSGIAFTQVEGDGYGTRRMAFLAFADDQPRWLTSEPMNGTHPQLRPLPDA